MFTAYKHFKSCRNPHFEQVPLQEKHLSCLCRLFVRLNPSKSGLIGLREFSSLFQARYPGIVSALCFGFVLQLVPCAVSGFLTVGEFVAMVHHVCTMNEEEMMRHVFDCLVTGEDALEDKLCDLGTLTTR